MQIYARSGPDFLAGGRTEKKKRKTQPHLYNDNRYLHSTVYLLLVLHITNHYFIVRLRPSEITGFDSESLFIVIKEKVYEGENAQ